MANESSHEFTLTELRQELDRIRESISGESICSEVMDFENDLAPLEDIDRWKRILGLSQRKVKSVKFRIEITCEAEKPDKREGIRYVKVLRKQK
jgi:hypothetical protein